VRATIVLLIVLSNKTQLTLFQDKQVYLVYLMIGNIPKAICQKPLLHAQLLMGYIPTTKLQGISNKSTQHHALANLFYSCMDVILGPIASYGETGLPIMSSDRVWQRCHPIFAIFIGDYPEQALVTCTYYGQCPKYTVPPDELGEYKTFLCPMQSKAINTYLLADNGDIHTFHLACCEAGLKPIFRPFWASLPLVNIFISITLDILY